MLQIAGGIILAVIVLGVAYFLWNELLLTFVPVDNHYEPSVSGKPKSLKALALGIAIPLFVVGLCILYGRLY